MYVQIHVGVVPAPCTVDEKTLVPAVDIGTNRRANNNFHLRIGLADGRPNRVHQRGVGGDPCVDVVDAAIPSAVQFVPDRHGVEIGNVGGRGVRTASAVFPNGPNGVFRESLNLCRRNGQAKIVQLGLIAVGTVELIAEAKGDQIESACGRHITVGLPLPVGHRVLARDFLNLMPAKHVADTPPIGQQRPQHRHRWRGVALIDLDRQAFYRSGPGVQWNKSGECRHQSGKQSFFDFRDVQGCAGNVSEERVPIP